MGITNMCALIAVPHDKDDEYLTHNSQDFHAHMGYRLVGAFDRCAQKFGRWYDMCWMELVLTERVPNQPQTNLVPRPPNLPFRDRFILAGFSCGFVVCAKSAPQLAQFQLPGRLRLPR